MMATASRPALSLLIGLSVLSSRAYSQQVSQDSLKSIIAAIPDSQVRRLLLTAAQSGGFASILWRMFSYDTPVLARRTTGVALPRHQFGPPQIPDSILADVRPYSANPIAEYRGAYVLTDTGGSRLVGQLDSIATPFQLFYKLPQNRRLQNVGPGARLQLRLIDESYGMSRHRTVFLLSETGLPILLYYSDGGATLHRFSTTDPPVQITQQQEGGRGGRGGGGRGGGASASTTSVTLGGQAANGLHPGQRVEINWQGRRFEVVLLESSAAGNVDPGADGDRYHVTVLIYALP